MVACNIIDNQKETQTQQKGILNALKQQEYEQMGNVLTNHYVNGEFTKWQKFQCDATDYSKGHVYGLTFLQGWSVDEGWENQRNAITWTV